MRSCAGDAGDVTGTGERTGETAAAGGATAAATGEAGDRARTGEATEAAAAVEGMSRMATASANKKSLNKRQHDESADDEQQQPPNNKRRTNSSSSAATAPVNNKKARKKRIDLNAIKDSASASRNNSTKRSDEMMPPLPSVIPGSSGWQPVQSVSHSNYSSLGGLESVLQSIHDLIELPLLHADLFAQLGVAVPSGVLLHGAPGTGKTTLAWAIAGQLGVSFFSLSATEILEAVLENLPLKQRIFAELEKVTPKHCILATNTSTIDIDKIGEKTSSQDRILGLHFFSPAQIMPLLEIVRTKHTSKDVLATSLAMSKRIGKTPVVSGNCVGFIANRAFFPYGHSASFLVDAGLSPYRIDAALLKFGMPMGAFRMSDLSGIDNFIHVSAMINSAYGERCYNSTLLHKLVQAGRLGQKSGKGYYAYNLAGKNIPDEAALKPFLEAARADANLGIDDINSLTDEQIVQIIFYPVVNESLRILDEGFASSMADIDVTTVMGYGYPAYRAGVLHWAEHQAKGGWSGVNKTLSGYSQQFGKLNPKLVKFFEPCALLQKLAAGGKFER